ncbi:MAG: molecular chaperone TorD family protein, partial [bacterium]|nr:molecular chaperone TorD family protein [bacterium]
PKRQEVATAAADLLRSEAPEKVELALAERPPADLDLRPVVKELEKPRQHLIAEHQNVFGLLLGKTAPPNETEYCRSTDSFYRAGELADIAGFYRAFGLERDSEKRERPDHLSLELEFMAHVIAREVHAEKSDDPRLREKVSVCREAQRNFFEAHLAWWVPGFAELLHRTCTGGLYAALAPALASFVPLDRSYLGVKPPRQGVRQKSEPEPAGEAGGLPCECPG